VHFVGIVYQDKPEQASAFLDEFGRGTNYSYVVDPESRATVELGVFGVPETYIIDGNGIIQGKIAGEVNAAVLSRALDQVLAGQTPDL
jgi:cytochrome c biogenesis protein CcmG/thiol:disulfide interchange protein DsbE